jgi:hypothetical protein
LHSGNVETELPHIDHVVMEEASPVVTTMENQNCCSLSQCVPQTITLSTKSTGASEISVDGYALIDSGSELCIDHVMLSENEKSKGNKPQYYRKYKNMIAASIIENVDHGWRSDIVREKVWKFHKDLTVRIMGP